jgi:cellulose synthase/poly-beta-1,6-N-acetylglucosamine synthase-like glycosyltransferase
MAPGDFGLYAGPVSHKQNFAVAPVNVCGQRENKILRTSSDTNEQRNLSISVVIPAYNADKTIVRAIDSALAQTRRADEIIVVDDGSTDETSERIKRYSSQVRYIYQENAGPSVARNKGIEAACSEWIAFLDSDDEWLPKRLGLQCALLGRNEHLVWAGGNFYRCLCDENRRRADVNPDRVRRVLKGKEYFDDFFRTSLPHGCGWTGTMLIKKEVLQEAGMFDANLHIAEDTDLWFRIACRRPQIGYVSEPLAVYHMTTAASLMQKHKQLKFQSDLVARQLQFASEHGRLDAFKPCVGRAVSSHIRGLLFENRPAEIRRLLDQFDELLTQRFKIIIRLLLVFPRATAVLCHGISKVVRALNLRKETVRKPGQIRETLEE